MSGIGVARHLAVRIMGMQVHRSGWVYHMVLCAAGVMPKFYASNQFLHLPVKLAKEAYLVTALIGIITGYFFLSVSSLLIIATSTT